jgi:hypothetical protein
MGRPNLFRNCEVVDDIDTAVEGTESFFSFYPDGDFNENTGGQENIQSLQELVQDAAINHRDIACRLNIIKEAVPDYKDNNLVNSCLLQYPYGRGGMHETRLKKTKNGYEETTSIDIQEYVEYLSVLSQPHFHQGVFPLILYNMMLKQKMVRTAHWQLRNKLTSNLIATKITFEDVEDAIASKRSGSTIQTAETQRGRIMLDAIDAVCHSCPHSNAAAKQAKLNAYAIQHHYGCPTFFLTVTPDDDNHFSMQILANEVIDCQGDLTNVASDDHLMNKAKQRTELRLKYPGLSALFFEMALHTIIAEVFGWDINAKKQENNGLFGRIDAFTCTVEEQGRSTLHAHFLIWCTSVNNF